MTSHLLLITLGPVQEFIAQARRTRDLWFGSHLLSEVSRATAKALAVEGAALIFPALKLGDPELEPCRTLIRPETDKPPLNIANKILAEIKTGDATELRRVACAGRTAAEKAWKDEAQRVLDHVRREGPSLLASGIDAVWTEQIKTFLEIYAAWVPVRGNYGAARDQVEQAIAGRKNLREFEQWQHDRGGAPKSSLDGVRVSVLEEAEPANPKRREPGKEYRHAGLARCYRITGGEQLDAVGLVKRAGGDPEPFVSVLNVAVSTWLAWADRQHPQALAAVRAISAEVGIDRVRMDIGNGRLFPFNAGILFPGRWDAVLSEQYESRSDSGKSKTDRSDAAKRFVATLKQRLNAHIGGGGNRLRPPFPYVACLVADGDRMGKAIDGIGDADNHRTFSREMSKFAQKARSIVETDHLGLLIYSGGDDVLAFLPVPTALNCAKALREEFAKIMDEACRSLNGKPGFELPTLSVGIGIGHVLEGMADLLALGRRAEKLAKDGTGPENERNALAVLVDKRSGGVTSWRRRWLAHGEDAPQLLDQGRKLLADGTVSSGKIFQVQAALRRFPQPQSDTADPPPDFLVRDILHVLRHSDAGSRTKTPKELGLWTDTPGSYAEAHQGIRDWVARMIIAKTLNEGDPTHGDQDTPTNHEEEEA